MSQGIETAAKTCCQLCSCEAAWSAPSEDKCVLSLLPDRAAAVFEMLDVMVVAEENEQVVWQGLLRQGWSVCLSMYGCDLCLRPMVLGTNIHVAICAYLLCSL